MLVVVVGHDAVLVFDVSALGEVMSGCHGGGGGS